MLDQRSGTGPAGTRRALGATWASAGVHVAVAVIALAVTGRNGGPENTARPSIPTAFVLMERPGDLGGTPTDGGRRFGNHTDRPPTAAERPGTARRTVPAAPPRSLEAAASPVEPNPQQIVVPVVPEASGLRDVPGAVSDISAAGLTPEGPGSARGAGDRDGGTGLRGGPGHLRALDPGTGGITPPALIRQVRPNYTMAAMQARVRGVVVMDVVVLPDGSVGEVKIVRSIDPNFGLDQEAIKAVRQWRFRPASRAGTPVAMLVMVEMLFELR